MQIFRLDAALRQELKTSWVALALAVMCMFFAFGGPAFSMPFILKEMISVFGWSREEAALIASFKYATGAVFSILVGRFLDLFGIRRALIFTSFIAGFALTMFLWLNSLETYYLAGILLGLGSPGMVVALKSFLSRAFETSQGTAIGIMWMGASAASVAVPLLITAAIGAWGWRYGIASMSLGVWLVALPVLIFAFPKQFMERPEDVVSRQPTVSAFGTFFSDIRFWILGGAMFLSGVVDQAFIQHQPLIFKDIGLSDQMGALAISAFGLLSFVLRPLIGNLFDTTSLKGVAATYALMAFACVLALVLTSPIILMIFVLFRAIGHSGVLLDSPTIGKHVFGVKNFGLLLGLFTAFVNAGFAIGPWLMGRLFDASGSYASSFWTFAALGVVAALMVLLVKPEKWLAMKEADVDQNQSVNG
jgi:MFS family permease